MMAEAEHVFSFMIVGFWPLSGLFVFQSPGLERLPAVPDFFAQQSPPIDSSAHNSDFRRLSLSVNQVKSLTRYGIGGDCAMQEIAAKQESSAQNGTATIENLCSGWCGFKDLPQETDCIKPHAVHCRPDRDATKQAECPDPNHEYTIEEVRKNV
jgi:hypothetical protein